MPNTWYHTPKFGRGNHAYREEKVEVTSRKRVAIAGEQIIITNKHYASNFTSGDIFTVSQTFGNYVTLKDADQDAYHYEYEVIVIEEDGANEIR